MQTTWRRIGISFVSLLAVGALGWGFTSQQRVKHQQVQLTRLQQQNTRLQKQQAQTHGTLVTAEAQAKQATNQAKSANNNRGVSRQVQATNKTMVATVTSVFQGLFNYTPTTYQQRGAKLKPQMTTALYQQYFGSGQGHYGDGNQVTSKLTYLQVYQAAVSGSQLKVLVVAQYQSKYADNASWQQGTSVYEVNYQASKRQVSAIKSRLSQNK